MDQQPPVVTPATPVTPTIPPAMPQVSPTAQAISSGGGGSKKAMMIVVILVLLLAALVGGGYYYYTTQMSKPAIQPQPAPAVQQPTSQKPAATTAPTPDQEINAVTINDNSSDFTSVDKDLQSL